MKKTALVTGPTSGIGYELAKQFAKEGHNLVLVARNKNSLEKVASEFKEKYKISVTIIAKDLGVLTSSNEIFSELRQMDIQIDFLINNAGFQVYGPFSETDAQKEEQMIQTNLTSLTQLTKLFLPGMLNRGEGKILNVGSVGSYAAGPLNAVYCATKAYVLSFSEALSQELKGSGVTVTALCPGATRTEFAKRASMMDVRAFSLPGVQMNANQVAVTGYRALMKGKTSVVPGFMNKSTILFFRFIPRKMASIIFMFFMGRKSSSKTKPSAKMSLGA
jgi:short-subunit dehydrogenase